MVRLIVYARQQHVLECDAAAGQREVFVGRRQDRGNAETAIGRHDLVTEFVIGGVQRDGQVVLTILLGQPADALRQADGGDRDPPRADAQTVAGGGLGQGGQQGVEVQ